MRERPGLAARRSRARSRALRARGLAAVSAAAGAAACGVSRRKRGGGRGARPRGSWRDGAGARPAASPMKRLTIRSSSEWNDDHHQPRRRARAAAAACASARSISPSSSFTRMRSAWKLRVAGSMPERSVGSTERMIAASRPVVSIGASARAATIARAMRREAALLAERVEHVGKLRLGQRVDEIGGGRPVAAHAHVERAVARGS